MEGFRGVYVVGFLILIALPVAGLGLVQAREIGVPYALASEESVFSEDTLALTPMEGTSRTFPGGGNCRPSEVISSSQTVAVIVEASIYPGVNASVAQYEEDLHGTGYDTILYTEPIGTAEELKSILLTWYETESLVGAVLIGRLPYAQYHHPKSDSFSAETFICDLYLTDLDGTWQDSNPIDGIYDSHDDPGLGDIYPEIFLGRIDPTCLTWGTNTTDHINTYLTRVHQYRTGLVERQKRALVYVDDDWAGYFGTIWNGDVGNAYSTRTLVQTGVDTNASDWRTNRLLQDYQWTHVCVHSWASAHVFGPGGYGSEGTVTSAEIRAIPPAFSFYSLFACSGASWTFADNLAVTYTFSGPYSLAAIGSSKTGGMMDCDSFYGPLGDDNTLGSCLQQWFCNTLNDDSQAGDEYLQWYYGMNIVGDPLLTIDYDCTVLPPLVSSPTHPNQDLWYPDRRPLFQWSEPEDVNDITGYYYIIDTLPYTCPSQSTGIYTDENWAEAINDLDDGTWYIHVVARDSVGNVGEVAGHYEVNVDTTPPDLSIIWPVENYNATTTFLDLDWQIVEYSSGYLRTEIWLDSPLNLIYNGTTTEYGIEGLSEGIHVINMTAVDLAGNRECLQIAFTVDATRPAAHIVEPINGAHLGPDLTLTWNADDDCSGYQKAEVRLDGTLFSTIWAPQLNTTLVGLSWGSHLINVTVFDWAGLSASSAVQIMVWTPTSQGLIVVGAAIVVVAALWRYRVAGH